MIKNVLFCVSEPESPRTSHQVPQGSTSGSSRNGFVRRNLPGNQEHKRTGKGLKLFAIFYYNLFKVGFTQPICTITMWSRYPKFNQNSNEISDRRCLENESQTLESRYPEFRTNETLLYNLLYC